MRKGMTPAVLVFVGVLLCAVVAVPVFAHAATGMTFAPVHAASWLSKLIGIVKKIILIISELPWDWINPRI